MAEPSALEVLGEQLNTTLINSFAPLPGTSTELAFFPGGVDVSPESFFVDGVVNPMLVGNWLTAMADTAPAIVSGQASITMSTASDLMRSVALFAESTAPVGTDAANVISRLKSLDSDATAPGIKIIDTEPRDWYDVAKVTDWPYFSSSSNTPTPHPVGSGSPIWRWKTLEQNAPLVVHPMLPPGASPVRASLIASVGAPLATAHMQPAFSILRAGTPGLISAGTSAATVGDSPTALLTQTSARAAIVDQMRIAPPAAVQSVAKIDLGSQFRLNSTIFREISLADAATTPVTASSLTLTAHYRMVRLTRPDWWSSDLIDAPGWCFAGQRAGALVPGNLPANAQVGVPVALILTSDVSISGTWSDADRSAATTSTHLGPWQLPQNCGLVGGSTNATLSIPGMQLVAAVYAILPTLPPSDDPALPPRPVAAAGCPLTRPLVVPEYVNGVVTMYAPDPITRSAVAKPTFAVNVQAIVSSLFPGKTAKPNACALSGDDLFVACSSDDLQCILKVPGYLSDPQLAVARAFVFTRDGDGYVGLTVDGAGNLYTAEGDYQDNHVVMYAGTGVSYPGATAAASDAYTARIDLGNAGVASYFSNMVVDAQGNLWVTDYLNHRVVVFDAANLGKTNTYHVLGNLTGPIPVANTNPALSTAASYLFAEPEGLAFDASGSLWVANDNDANGSGGVQNGRTSLVRLSPELQQVALGSAPGATVVSTIARSNIDFFIYQVPNLADDAGALPQFGGLQIDRDAGRIYVSEQTDGNGRGYDLAGIAHISTTTGPTDLAIVTTDPGNGGIALLPGTQLSQ